MKGHTTHRDMANREKQWQTGQFFPHWCPTFFGWGDGGRRDGGGWCGRWLGGCWSYRNNKTIHKPEQGLAVFTLLHTQSDLGSQRKPNCKRKRTQCSTDGGSICFSGNDWVYQGKMLSSLHWLEMTCIIEVLLPPNWHANMWVIYTETCTVYNPVNCKNMLL